MGKSGREFGSSFFRCIKKPTTFMVVCAFPLRGMVERGLLFLVT